MPLTKLSSIKASNPALHSALSELRTAVYKTGSYMIPDPETPGCIITSSSNEINEVLSLINSPANSSGEFYQYFFDETAEDANTNRSGDDPAGNNILILAIAKAAFYSGDTMPIIHRMIDTIIEDAKSKLAPEAFKEFINFNFDRDSNPDAYVGYHNTPLTLAIKCGLAEAAIKLVNYGADVNIACDTYGGFSPLHLAVLRLPLVAEDKKAPAAALIKTLLEHGATTNHEDIGHHTPEDLFTHYADEPLFNFKTTHNFNLNNLIRKNLITEGEIGRKYSFAELAGMESFKTFIASKGFSFPTPAEITFDSFKAFVNFIKTNKDETNNSFVFFTSADQENYDREAALALRNLGYDANLDKSSLELLVESMDIATSDHEIDPYHDFALNAANASILSELGALFAAHQEV